MLTLGDGPQVRRTWGASGDAGWVQVKEGSQGTWTLSASLGAGTATGFVK